MGKFKVAVSSATFGHVNKEPVEELIEAGCEVNLNELGRPYEEKELIDIASDCDALIVGNDHITEKVISSLPKLKIIAKHGVGIDKIDISAADKHQIYVTNVPSSNSNEVADLVFAFIGSLARFICLGNKEVREGTWNKRRGQSLYKKTIGIIGTGDIGKLVAKRANGYEMRILGYDLIENEEAKNLGVEYMDLINLLTEADFISLHLPSTPSTERIIDEKALSQMKNDALLVNTARENLVDLDALEQALANESIGGFATDVFDREPAEYKPYFDYQNVLLTPHIGATTFEANLRMGMGAISSVLAVKNEQKPQSGFLRNKEFS